jgi:hypothetical protein
MTTTGCCLAAVVAALVAVDRPPLAVAAQRRDGARLLRSTMMAARTMISASTTRLRLATSVLQLRRVAVRLLSKTTATKTLAWTMAESSRSNPKMAMASAKSPSTMIRRC